MQEGEKKDEEGGKEGHGGKDHQGRADFVPASQGGSKEGGLNG